MWTRSVLWVDAQGYVTLTRINTDAGLDATAFAALLACSRADWQQCWESAMDTHTPAPAGGTYSSVGDRAALQFVCADATTVTLLIPAPSLSIFLADGETVDITSAPVVALSSAVIGQLVNAGGSLATDVVGGQRLPRARTPLKG